MAFVCVFSLVSPSIQPVFASGGCVVVVGASLVLVGTACLITSMEAVYTFVTIKQYVLAAESWELCLS